MTLVAWIIGGTFVGGVLGVWTAALLLLLPEKVWKHLSSYLVSFSVGTLLSAALIALLPEALERAGGASTHAVLQTLLVGIFLFFILEKWVLWRHCHALDCDTHGTDTASGKSAGPLIIIGDLIHNFVDGVLIGATFLTDVRLGIVTSFAVTAHEIPRELGDFAVLLHSGFTKKRALYWNTVSALFSIVGGITAFFVFRSIEWMLPYVLAVAISGFLYVALSDLIPLLHQRSEWKSSIIQLLSMIAGAGVILLAEGNQH